MRKIFSRALAAITAVVGFTLLATPAFAQTYYPYTTTTAADAAAASAAGLGFSFVWLLCVCCVPLLIDSVIAYLVYKDATKHKIENAGLWAVLCFFFNIIGILIYFLVPRAEATKGKTPVTA
ncbi:MAG: PLDc N-terminal domain-containing protein [Candidatus Dojkabacteria bacterium]